MSDEPRTYRTKSGRVLTDAESASLAGEAEQGYDVERLARQPGRPRIGSRPALVVSVRLHADLHQAAKALAEAERTSLSELVRDALREHLATPSVSGALRTTAGRVLSDAEVRALSVEAEAGYDVAAPRARTSRRPGDRAEVVPVRMPPELEAAVAERAAAESTSVSEIVRAALRLRMERGDGPARGPVSPSGTRVPADRG